MKQKTFTGTFLFSKVIDKGQPIFVCCKKKEGKECKIDASRREGREGQKGGKEGRRVNSKWMEVGEKRAIVIDCAYGSRPVV